MSAVLLTAGDRTISFVLTDGDGGTATRRA
jgi:hypothetical protein